MENVMLKMCIPLPGRASLQCFLSKVKPEEKLSDTETMASWAVGERIPHFTRTILSIPMQDNICLEEGLGWVLELKTLAQNYCNVMT